MCPLLHAPYHSTPQAPHAPASACPASIAVWEFSLTLLFVQVQYAALFVLPGHGDVAPLTSGLALFAILDSGQLCLWEGVGCCHNCVPLAQGIAGESVSSHLPLGGFILHLRPFLYLQYLLLTVSCHMVAMIHV